MNSSQTNLFGKDYNTEETETKILKLLKSKSSLK